MAVLFTISLAILLYVSYRLYQHFFPAPDINPSGKYVLISGCDTGFGHALALELDKQGFNVLAGVFAPASVTSLTNELSSKATVFRLDISKQEDIDAAYDLVEGKTNTLHALVNNAGIGASGNIDWTSMETMRAVMDVNFFGHVAMTKKFLGLLIAKRDSRVVNICSVAGVLASAGLSAYCASKYALESFSDCLRREMCSWNLRVSIIEPGFMRTPIIQGARKAFPEFWSALPSDVQTRWGENFLKTKYGAAANNPAIKYAEDPIKVVRDLEHAVRSSAPRIRYRPGWQSSVIFYPVTFLPAGFVDWFLAKLQPITVLPASVSKQLPD